jgi:hypothetical protein
MGQSVWLEAYLRSACLAYPNACDLFTFMLRIKTALLDRFGTVFSHENIHTSHLSFGKLTAIEVSSVTWGDLGS